MNDYISELLEEVRELRRAVGAGVGDAITKTADKLAGALERQPVVVESRVELDGREVAKSTAEHFRRQSRGGQSVLQGVS